MSADPVDWKRDQELRTFAQFCAAVGLTIVPANASVLGSRICGRSARATHGAECQTLSVKFRLADDRRV
jgi:hypothetical protein